MNNTQVPKISCIVPAHNEENRITTVLRTLIAHPLITEVIAVNDGSSDNTGQVLQSIQGIRCISYTPNKGKSHAVLEGLQAASYDIILMIDADLVGLTEEDITNLVMPVITGASDISFSLRSNSLQLYKMLGIDFVTGERCFNKSLIPDLQVLDTLPGYGLESFLNSLIIQQKKKITIVRWKHVMQSPKQSKVGTLRGMRDELHMVRQIISVLGIFGPVTQIFRLKKLIVADS